MRHHATPVGVNLKEAFHAQSAHFLRVETDMSELVAEGTQNLVVHDSGVGLRLKEMGRSLVVWGFVSSGKEGTWGVVERRAMNSLLSSMMW